jgi:hypothetical protein
MTRLSPKEAEDDSYRSWQLNIAVLREINIRNGSIKPDKGDKTHARWVSEGPVKPSLLETVRGQK